MTLLIIVTIGVMVQILVHCASKRTFDAKDSNNTCKEHIYMYMLFIVTVLPLLPTFHK